MMILNVKEKKLIKARVSYNLTPLELKLLLCLANGRFNTHSSIKRFAYKNEAISDQVVKDKVEQLKNRYALRINTNNYGVRMRSTFGIDY